jgi:hypothetical protein
VEREILKFDDASWHYGGKFPKDLPNAAGATHTGMYLAWALLSGLGGAIHADKFAENIDRLRSRSVTPGAFFLEVCDGKFSEEDLNEEGNTFTSVYFDFENGKYLADYERTVGQGLPELYYVKDTWENFDLLGPVLSRRLNTWRWAQRIRRLLRK